MSELEVLKNRIQLINETVSNDTYNLGEAFFEKTVLNLNQALDADYTFIGELEPSNTSVQTIALANKTGILDNMSYDLAHTPCENVVGQKACSHSCSIQELFPKDQLLIDMNIEGYVGIPLYDSEKNPTGIMVCLFEKPIEDTGLCESILTLFAARAGAELEHIKLTNKIKQHEENLKKVVDIRTKELQLKNEELNSIIKQLTDTQSKLIQSDKMASLGVLTAGVAHEINNPLNFIRNAQLAYSEYFNTHGSQDEELTDLLEKSLDEGVERISSIVNSLNQFSRNTEDLNETCCLNQILKHCIVILAPKIKSRIEIKENLNPEPFEIKGNSGKLHQVFINLLSNAIDAIDNRGTIHLMTERTEKHAIVKIKDSGAGISKEDLERITDPFFTTKPPGKGTGMGLSISQSILREHNATLTFESNLNEGTTVNCTFKLN